MILVCVDFIVWFYDYFIAFIENMNAGKSVYTNLFFLNDYKKNEKIISKYLKTDMKKQA